MAAKSDFAQKLLCDLRLRKERMATPQGSARDNATVRDAYRNPGNVQRGSRQTKSLESMGGSKRMNHQPISSRGSDRSLGIKESSQQLVSYAGGQHRRSESIGDLSMAFTYAVKNGGKLMNMDFSTSNNTQTMIDFFHQIGRRSLDVGNSRNQTTTTSLVKHNAISPTLTTFQIKEISKGVQNLYEIIRTSSNGTNINRYSMEIGKELLKGAKGLEESLRMLVNLEEASELMVNPQRKSRITLLEVDDDDDNPDDRSKNVDRNHVALPRFSFDKPSKKSNLALTDGSVRVLTHRRSDSAGAESLRSVTGRSNTSVSEKGRISNVIAKLMGLEEIPLKVDSYSKRDEIKKTDDSSMNTVNKTSRSVRNVEVLSNDRKSQQIQDPNANGSSRTNQSNKNNRSDRISERQEKEQNVDQVKEKMHPKRRSAEVVGVEKKKIVRREKSNEIKLVSRNSRIQEKEKTQKSKKDSQQIKQVKHMILPLKELKTQAVEQNVKAKDSAPKAQEPERPQQTMMPVIRKKGDSVVISRAESPRTKEEVSKRRNRAVNNLLTPSKHKLSVMKETKIKDVCIHKDQKETNDKRLNLEKSESATRLVDVVPAHEKEVKSDPWPLTSEIVVAGSVERIIETSKLLENKPKKVFSASIQTEQEETYAISLSSAKSESKSHLDDIVPSYEEEIKSNPRITSEMIVSDCVERTIETSNLSENKPKKAFNSSIQVVLTEDEKLLKEIMMKDQLFLSTAEALFRLNIPVGFLHIDDHNHHQNDTKLKLDCGYEILKRKARSQELSVHPYAKPSIGDKTIRFLDELVKQLYKDLEDLRLYGRDTRNEYDEADYLHHMLEKDIHNKNPDINSFWDFGWHIKTFTFVEKDEFVKDVEQEVFHRLVDEILNDLLGM